MQKLKGDLDISNKKLKVIPFETPAHVTRNFHFGEFADRVKYATLQSIILPRGSKTEHKKVLKM